MKKIIIAFITLVIIIIGANYTIKNYTRIKEERHLQLLEKQRIEEKKRRQEELKEKRKEQMKMSKNRVEHKLSLLRKRYILKGLIQKGDIYLENSQNLLALKSYLGAIKKTPNDKIIIKKIGDTYLKMKKFQIAYNYYTDLLGSNIIEPKKLAITYIYTLPKDKKDFKFEEIKKTFSKFNLTKEDSFFYLNSLECVKNTSSCQKRFEKYTKYYKGKNKNILYIKKAFNDYKALQIKKQYFKDTLILDAIFKAKLYPISNILAKNILDKKTNYLPVLKIIAKGNFELINYQEAKKYLLQYNKIDKKDSRVNYMLGVINIKLHEYILSNIFFANALKYGYSNKAEVSRRLIYNYYLAKDKNRMIREFKNLIENSENLNAIDYSLAIYYSIILEKKKQANKWINIALKLFPKNDNFYAYKGWIYKEVNDITQSELYFRKGFKLNSHNPLINLNLGLIEKQKGNFLKAKIYLKNTLTQDPNGDFGKFATKKLEEILLQEEKEKIDVDNNY